MRLSGSILLPRPSLATIIAVLISSLVGTITTAINRPSDARAGERESAIWRCSHFLLGAVRAESSLPSLPPWADSVVVTRRALLHKPRRSYYIIQRKTLLPINWCCWQLATLSKLAKGCNGYNIMTHFYVRINQLKLFERNFLHDCMVTTIMKLSKTEKSNWFGE